MSMAEKPQQQHQNVTQEMKKLFSSYIGLSFSVFLALLPNNLRSLSIRAFRAEDELRQMRSRWQKDSKTRSACCDGSTPQAEEIARLRAMAADSKARVDELEHEVAERDEMIGFVSKRLQEEGLGGCGSREYYGAVPLGNKSNEWFHKEEEEILGTTNGSHVDEEVEVIYQQQHTQHFGNHNSNK